MEGERTRGPRHHWFWETMQKGEVSSRDPMRDALQQFMMFKVIQRLEEIGVLQWEVIKYLWDEIHHPHWEEWMMVWSKRFPKPLQVYDRG